MEPLQKALLNSFASFALRATEVSLTNAFCGLQPRPNKKSKKLI